MTIAVLDVHYRGVGAVGACVVAPDWPCGEPTEERTAVCAEVKDYVPGRFYERELPPLVAVLATVTTPLDILVVDGYVDLGPDRPGLGAHLWDHFEGRHPVVGIAKNEFRGATPVACLRGSGRRPLYVTARGLPGAEAARLVGSMHGEHRIPTLVRRADRLARFPALVDGAGHAESKPFHSD